MTKDKIKNLFKSFLKFTSDINEIARPNCEESCKRCKIKKLCKTINKIEDIFNELLEAEK